MTCPVCGGSSKVMSTRSDCDGVYRRRRCRECNHIFYTTETDSDGSDLKRIENNYSSENRIRKMYGS